MLQAEKIFEKIASKNHSIDSEYVDNKIRIKDRKFSIKSIYKIAEHLKWIKENKTTNEVKIIIDSEYIVDQAIITLFEVLIYFVLNEWNLKIIYRFSVKENLLGYEIYKKNLLFKYNNKKINIDEYNSEFNKELSFTVDHFRKVCRNTEENKKNDFISVTMEEVGIFLKCFEIDNEYRSELAEVIAEVVDNALKHSNGDCILNINVLKNAYKKYKYVDVAILVVDDTFVGKNIIEYIKDEDKSEYSERNKIVIDAYNNHKVKFNENYGINQFAMISAFQKYVTTRKDIKNSGGTGLTTLIEALIDKSNENFCYAISGPTNLLFKREFLTLNDEGLVGFNLNNDYIYEIPDRKVVSINTYDMNVNIYNLQFILKESNDNG